jgi:hypothetical protein
LALLLAAGDKFGRFHSEPSKNNVVCSQHTKKTTDEPFHFLHMGPMSDAIMLGKLCVAGFEHVMSSWHCRWPKFWQISLRAKPKPRLFAASTPRKPLLSHFISPIWVQYE